MKEQYLVDKNSKTITKVEIEELTISKDNWQSIYDRNYRRGWERKETKVVLITVTSNGGKEQ